LHMPSQARSDFPNLRNFPVPISTQIFFIHTSL
jgi:hypothetical protein